jgi:hypothetical protein
MMNNVQGDCRCGSLGFPAGEDLTLATGKLAKLNADGHVVLPAANTDITPYVITCGADQGYLCGVTPLNSLSNSRVILKGTCQSGQLLVAVGDGRVETGTLSGTAIPVGVAEEDGVEGQHVLLRPLCVGTRGAAGAAGTEGTPGAPGAQGPQGPAGAASEMVLRVTAADLGFAPAVGQCVFLVNPEGTSLAWYASVPESNTGVFDIGVVTALPQAEGGTYEIVVFVIPAGGYMSRVPLACIAGTPSIGGLVNPELTENGYFLTAGSAASFTSYMVAYLTGRDGTHGYLCVSHYNVS